MTDQATSCNATFDNGKWSGPDNRVHACASPVGHVLAHTSVPTHGDEGIVWSDGAVGAKAHQVVHVRDAHDPEYLHQLLYQAWAVIANAGLHQGEWGAQHPEWVEAAERWRDEWHEVLGEFHTGRDAA